MRQKVKNSAERLWYASKTLEHGWSRAVLTVQIESGLFARQGNAVTNFEGRLPAQKSDLAQQSFKDPCLFDFLTLRQKAIERDLEGGLVAHIEKFRQTFLWSDTVPDKNGRFQRGTSPAEKPGGPIREATG